MTDPVDELKIISEKIRINGVRLELAKQREISANKETVLHFKHHRFIAVFMAVSEFYSVSCRALPTNTWPTFRGIMANYGGDLSRVVKRNLLRMKAQARTK